MSTRSPVEFTNIQGNRVGNKIVLTDSETGQTLAVDSVTGALISIDFSHHEVHEGDHFTYTNAQDISNGATISFTIITPDTTKWSHFGFELDGQAEFDVLFYENATPDTIGTPVTNPAVINSNRNSQTVNTLVINSSPAVGAGSKGTLIKHFHSGSGKAESGKSGSGTETILKQNTTYWVDVTNATTSNNYISWVVSWYEHTNAS